METRTLISPVVWAFVLTGLILYVALYFPCSAANIMVEVCERY
ncbi:hypothetical protein Q2941_49085 [Bradyrhizobium sp. UFLA05-153]